MTGPVTVRAAVTPAAGAPPSVEPLQLPALGPRDLRVRVEASGICHTDLAWAAGNLFPVFPVVLGHEVCGRIEAAGDGVTSLTVGERVVVFPGEPCGACEHCEAGHPILCERGRETRALSGPGRGPVFQGLGIAGFAEAVVVSERMAVRVPDGVPPTVAAVTGCAVATGVGAVFNVAHLEPGSTALVIGCGGIGMSAILGCRAAGAERIVAIDPLAERRELALRLGATDAVAANAEQAREMFPAGFDYVFECAGLTSTIEMAIPLARPQGTVTLIGIPSLDADVTLKAIDLVTAQRRILGCRTGDLRPHIDFDRFFRLYLRGALDLDALVTSTYPLQEVSAAFADASAGRGLRTVLLPAEQG